MRLTLLSPLHTTALTDPQTWSDNPFVARERRRDVKRKQPTKLYAVMAVMMFVLLGLGIVGLWTAMKAHLRIPWFLGGDVGTVLCILIVGLHIWFVAGSSANRSTLMLVQEAHRDTLSSLLLLPMSPFQLLLQTGVYPWLAGMRTAFALLPLYVFCVALDGISWLDLAMLYIVFGLAAVSFPLWRRPMLSETALVTTPVLTAGANAAVTQAATGTAATPTGAQSANSANSSGGWMALFFMLPMAITGLAFIRGGSPIGMRDALSSYFPDTLLGLMLPSMLSWPLLMARGLITPFAWFGWHVAPLPFVLVFFLLARYLQLVRTSEFLSVGTFRDLAAQPTYLRRRRLEGAVRIAQVFVVTGYLWIWAVRDSGLGFLVHTPAKLNQAGVGLIGFVYLLLFVTLVRGLARVCQLGTWQRGDKAARIAVRSVRPQAALRYLAEPFLFCALFLVICALAAGVNPFTPFLLTLMGHMLAIGLAGMLLNYGATRLLGSLAPVLGLAIVVGWTIALSGYHLTIVQPLEYLSATLGLLYLGHIPWNPIVSIFEPGIVWWRWPLACGFGGLILTLTAMAMRIKISSVLPENVTPLLLDPTRVGEETFTDPPVMQKGEKPKLSDTPLALRLISALQRFWDNAVTTKELRVRLRGKLEFGAVRAVVILLIAVTLTFYQGLPIIPQVFGGGRSLALFGKQSVGGAILCCFFMVMLFRALIGGFTTFQAFMVERDKSTLGFLLLTPMSALSIIMGKLAGILLPGGIFLATLGAWTLLLSLLNLPDLGPVVLAVWGGTMLSVLLLIMTLGTSTLAVASIFPKIPMQYAGCLWAVLLQVV
ncbi:MAG: hypothetical protein JWL77_3861, partial [Chthonomonadaceae bacterium]|nr:hypothetical protein [Chthonomonadaceae bacterium]